MFELLIFLAIVAVVLHVVFSMIIVSELQKRGVKINFFLMRLFLPKYANEYKKLTIQETGKAGGLFYGWLVSINGALVFAIGALLVRAL